MTIFSSFDVHSGGLGYVFFELEALDALTSTVRSLFRDASHQSNSLYICPALPRT